MFDNFLFDVHYHFYNGRYWFRRWLFHRCSDCGKPDRVLGRWLRGHGDCVPF